MEMKGEKLELPICKLKACVCSFHCPIFLPLMTSLNFYCLAINSRICWERKEPTIISGRHLIPLLRGPQ